MIDTHAHIDTEAFDDDREKVIDFAFKSGVEAVIIPSIEPDKFGNVLDLAKKYDRIYCGIGIHPHNANSASKENLEVVESLAEEHKKVVAIGEIGLDYYYDFAPKEVQKQAFRSQLKIAKKLGLPVIVHNRESDDDLLEIIKEEQDGTLKGVLHCFSSDMPVMEKAIELGFHISFTGNITFKKFDRQDVVKNVPNDRFMIETDSPYMAPVPNRGKRNQPSFVRLVAEKIAEIKEIPINEVVKMTTANAKQLFNISMMAVIMILASMQSFAQSDDVFDDDYYEEEEIIEEEWVNPYKKFIGIGGVIGTNTIVQTFKNDEQEVTYEGIFAFGGAVTYGIFDYMWAQAAYVYSKNTKIGEQFEGEIEGAENTHQMYELTVMFTPNPGGRINVFAGAGPTISLNEYFQGVDNMLTQNEFGINATVGFLFNQKFNGAGLLTVSAEWRLNFILGQSELEFDPRENNPNSGNPVDISTFFSIPRLTISFFPEF